MLKQKIKKYLNSALCVVIAGVLLLSGMVAYGSLVRADEYDEKIRQLENRNADKQRRVDQLGAQASSYQDAINKLANKISSLERAIRENQEKSRILAVKIDKEQRELERQKKILGDNIRTMYLEGDVSTFEILASSDNLGDFIDQQQYHNSVQSKVKNTVHKIEDIKLALENKKRILEGQIRDQQDQQADLAETQAEHSQMLSYTASKKASFERQIQSNNGRIAELRAQQAAANATLGGAPIAGDPNHGGYPAKWDNACQDCMLDDWGMYNRECVSYTAWKVYQTYGYMPYWGGHGNANQWPASARADGIQTGSVPKAKSVAISMSGYYGHAMWVEWANGNTIHVSQYNYHLTGRYSEMTINGSGLIYIYFK